MRELYRDFRYACRGLLRNPGIATVIVLTLAIGIGANSAVFTYLMEIHRERFEAPQPERTFLFRASDDQGNQNLRHSMPDFLDARAGLGDLADLTAWSFLASVAVLPSGESLYTFGSAIEPGYFEFYGRRPHLGRSFLPEENTPGGDRVVVIDYGFWKRRLGSDPEIVGKTMEIGRAPYTIIGVGPQGFQSTGLTLPLYIPAARLGELTRREAPFSNREERAFFALLRLAEGVERGAVEARLESIASTLDAEHPLSDDQRRILTLRGVEEYDGLPNLNEVLPAIATAFLLLLACANVGNLLLARMAGRRQEIAVYSALGASGGRIAQRLLVESLLLATAGGVLGIFLGRLGIWKMRSYLEVLPIGMAGWAEGTQWMMLDERGVFFTLALALVTGLLFGLIPARHAARFDPASALRGGGAGSEGGVFGLRRALVVVQVLLSTVLVLGAFFLMQSFQGLSDRPLGFDPEDKLFAAFATARDTTLEALERREQERQLYESGRSRLAGLASVSAVGLLSEPPGTGANPARVVFPEKDEAHQVAQTIIDEEFFTVVDVAVRGRLFRPTDRAGTQGAAIVNQAFVAAYYSEGEEALGREIVLPDLAGVDIPEARFLIVGVAEDIIHGSRRKPAHPMIYLPLRQVHRSSRMIYILRARSPGERSIVAIGAQREGPTIHPDLAFIEVGTIETQMYFDLDEERLDSMSATIVGFLGLALACLGIYSVMHYSVGARRREIGIRMAVGARREDIVRTVLWEAGRLIGLGILLGAFISLLLTRHLESLLYGVEARDPLSYFLVCLFLAAVGLLSAWLPASRAGQIDPQSALRQD